LVKQEHQVDESAVACVASATAYVSRGFQPTEGEGKRFSSRSDRSCGRGVGRAGCV